MFSTSIALMALLSCFAAHESQAAAKPVKVFILAGQSNMQGQAVIDLDHEQHYNGGRGTLVDVMKGEDPRYAHLRDAAGKWVERDDVWISYQRSEKELRTGPLGIGFAAYTGLHHFGVELQFGHVVGDALKEPVLLIKTAWGGKSLHKDFRPPSAGGVTGSYYTRMMDEIRTALAAIGSVVPEYGKRGYELCGFVWFQGWNDMGDKAGLADYAQNLIHLIRDVRKELKAPQLPVVIGETGNANSPALHKAQEAAARHAAFRGTVTFVPTKRFLRPAAQSPNVGHGHHWFGNASSYFLIGHEMGEAMLALIDG